MELGSGFVTFPRIVNIVLDVPPVASDDLVMLVGLLTLLPLALLLFTGLYLFLLPYITNDRRPRSHS